MDTTSESGLTGSVLEGRYEVGPILARGGMSLVYRGVDTRLGRPVAIKVMKHEFADDPAFLARFEREARAAATLDHPGVVAVYDQGRDGHHVFLVMELVDGGTLRDLIRDRGALPVPVALSVLEQMLAGLGAAHDAGLVHRDVKPENVLISSKGEVKVADFGLVRAVSSMTMATGDVILGTVAYLSPEQVSTGYSDERSDVYAAGVVGYEMLTGHPPFSGENAMSVAYQHVHSDVPPPSEVTPEVPQAIDFMIVEATSRDADRRPATAGDFLAESLALRAELGIRRVLVPTPPTRPSAESRPSSPSSHTTVRPAGPTGTRAVPGRRGADHPTTVGRPSDTAHPTTVGRPPLSAGSTPASFLSRWRERRRNRPPQTVAQRRRRRNLIALLIVLLLGIGAAVGGWWLGSGRWTSLPSVVGQQAVSAESAVRDADLVPVLSTAADDDAPLGTVISTDPTGGSRQLRDSTVSMVVSAGRPRVPSVAPGTSQADARAAIEAAALRPAPAPREEPHEEIARGSVVTTDPPPGTTVKLDSVVTLVVSSGPTPLAVPEVTDKGVEDAQNKLIATGFRVGTQVDRFDPDEPAGTVLGTRPAAGADVAKGSEVSLIVSNSLTVPAVSTRSAASARLALTQAGFTPAAGGVRFSATVDGGDVVATEPRAGALVDPADPTVRLILSNAVTVPEVRGRSIEEAQGMLGALGLNVDTNTPWFFGNSVRSQEPAADTRVEPSSTVRISTVG